jgi:hypothetical protein
LHLTLLRRRWRRLHFAMLWRRRWWLHLTLLWWRWRRLHFTMLWRRWWRLHLTLLWRRRLHFTMLWRRRGLAWPLRRLFLLLLITLRRLRYHEGPIERRGVD